MSHLGYSLYEILFEYDFPSSMELKIRSMKRSKIVLNKQKSDPNNLNSTKKRVDAFLHHLLKAKTVR